MLSSIGKIMFHQKIEKLAEIIVHFSLELKKGQKVLIEVQGEGTDAILKSLINKTLEAGAIPYWNRNEDSLLASFIERSDGEQMSSWTQMHKTIMESVDAYVSIRGSNNSYQLSSVSQDKIKNYNNYFMQEVHMKLRVPKKRWVVLRWPNNAMAQLAEMSTEKFAQFYFETCTLDYSKLSEKMDSLVSVMEKTDKVRIKSPHTDIMFSIKNIPVIKCAGKINIPDGEVFTAPVKDSINGFITYNTPSPYQGKIYNNVFLEVKNGKIVNIKGDGDHESLQAIFNTDEGARYFGEFAIGVNPFITFPMKDILFDEKIYGSFHLTPGNSYDQAFNGNRSSVHWDLVQIQTPQFGGGEIYFDDVLIRKDGEFVLNELKLLNRL